jgi:hypothetical protein
VEGIDADEQVDLDFFSVFCEMHEMLLFPALLLQRKLHSTFMGAPYWEEMYYTR